MIIKDTPVTDLDGKPLKNQDGTDATLVGCVTQALLTLQGMPVGGEESFKRYMIARKVHDGQEIAVEDAAVIKTAAAGIFHPLTYGRIVDAIEGAAKEAAEKPQPE